MVNRLFFAAALPVCSQFVNITKIPSRQAAIYNHFFSLFTLKMGIVIIFINIAVKIIIDAFMHYDAIFTISIS